MPDEARDVTLRLYEQGNAIKIMKEFLDHWGTLPDAAVLHLYAIVDSAQDASLLAALHKATPETHSQCLLPDAQGPELSKAAPIWWPCHRSRQNWMPGNSSHVALLRIRPVSP